MPSHNSSKLPELSETGLAALNYVRHGLWVVPVANAVRPGVCSCDRAGRGCRSAGKHPRRIDGKILATNDAAVVECLWRRWPDMNVGLAPRRSGFIFLDVDRREDGSDALDVLAARFGEAVLETVRGSSGGGGWHVYFRLSPELDALLPRHHLAYGELGMPRMGVVAPSVHSSMRRYAWRQDAGPDVRAPLDVPPLLDAHLRELAAEGKFGKRGRGSWLDRLQRAADRSRVGPLRGVASQMRALRGV